MGAVATESPSLPTNPAPPAGPSPSKGPAVGPAGTSVRPAPAHPPPLSHTLAVIWSPHLRSRRPQSHSEPCESARILLAELAWLGRVAASSSLCHQAEAPPACLPSRRPHQASWARGRLSACIACGAPVEQMVACEPFASQIAIPAPLPLAAAHSQRGSARGAHSNPAFAGRQPEARKARPAATGRAPDYERLPLQGATFGRKQAQRACSKRSQPTALEHCARAPLKWRPWGSNRARLTGLLGFEPNSRARWFRFDLSIRL